MVLLPYIENGKLYDVNGRIIEKPSVLIVEGKIIAYGSYGYLSFKKELEGKKLNTGLGQSCKGFKLNSTLNWIESKFSELRGVGISYAVAELAGRAVGSYSSRLGCRCFYLKSKDKVCCSELHRSFQVLHVTATAAQRGFV